ncbi:hypothetical protein [Mycobacterium simiae]|uniref:hypothetical protein n=1 Tax=Mycobacterium simiae TaxID=1784 RepID=UPI00165F2637
MTVAATPPGPGPVDNRLVEKGWTTRKNAHGDTEWLPPAHLDRGHPAGPQKAE